MVAFGGREKVLGDGGVARAPPCSSPAWSSSRRVSSPGTSGPAGTPPPQASTPPKPPTAQGNRVTTVRASRSEGDADSKLDAIIKKLDERSETIEMLDKKVEGLRKEVEQLRSKGK